MFLNGVSSISAKKQKLLILKWILFFCSPVKLDLPLKGPFHGAHHNFMFLFATFKVNLFLHYFGSMWVSLVLREPDLP